MIHLSKQEIEIILNALNSRQYEIERSSTEYEEIQKVILYLQDKIK